METQERFIIPGLGVVILLAVFTLGAPVLYTVLLGLLGLAVVGTYFAPPTVQVETRAAIAVLGLIILIFYFNSLSFWLALLSFGAIGALQIRHRDALQRTPATIAWLNTLLAQRGAATAQTGADAGDAASTGAALSALQGRVTVAAIGAAVMGVIVLLSASMPWVAYVISYGGESEAIGFSGLEAAELISEEFGGGVTIIIFVAGAALALLSIASVILPRVVPILVGIAGMLLTLFAFIYVSATFGDGGSGYSGVSAVTFPHIGFFVTGGSFLLVTVLHVIPCAYRSRGKDKTGG